MKSSTKALLIVGGIALAMYLYSKNGEVSASGSGGGSGGSFLDSFPDAAVNLSKLGNQQSTTQPGYTSKIQQFIDAPINTTASIQAGVDVINSGAALPRISETLANVAKNSNIARLADGSIAQVTVTNAKTTATPSGYVAQANVTPTGTTPGGYKRYF